MKLLSREEHSFPGSSTEVWIALIDDSRGSGGLIVIEMELAWDAK